MTDSIQYKPGDTLLTSRPFAFVIFSSHRSQICDECWSRIEVGYGECCVSCGVVRYCDFGCRARAQAEHYTECGHVRRERGASDILRLVARIWRRLAEDKENLVETDLASGLSRGWAELMDNAERLTEAREGELETEYEQLERLLDPDTERPDWKTFVSIVGKIITNSFCLRSDRKITIDSLHNILFKSQNLQRKGGPIASEPFGIGLYLLASKLDHSCAPNATVVFHGRELRVMVEREMVGVGEARISYVNTMMDTRTRQDQLSQHWFFTCQCSLCSDPKSNALKQSVKCSKCSTGRPVDTTRWTLDGPCSECENTSDPKQEELVERYRELSLLVQQISGEQVEENTFNYLNSWVAALMGEVCGDKDVTYIRVAHYVHTICMQHRLWKPAIVYGEIVLPAFIYYFGKQSKIVAALLVRLHEAAYYSGLLDKGAKYLEQACTIYKVIPGEAHPLVSVDIAKFLM